MSETDRPDLAWCAVDSQLIFLDLARDRYFRLPEARNRELLDLLERNDRPLWHQPSDIPRPEDWMPPTRAYAPDRNGDFPLAKVARAIWVQRRIESRLRSCAFARVLHDMRLLVDRRTTPEPFLSATGEAMLAAFDKARLLRSAADRCLPRSLAVATVLASSGDRARIVLGVRSPPFGAHCWAQHGDCVLNDSLEEVSRYHPILVV